MVNEAKQNYMLGKLKEHNKDQNKFWKDIQILIPKMQERKVSDIVNPTTGVMCSGIEANNLMNEYFTDIGKNLADKIPISNLTL